MTSHIIQGDRVHFEQRSKIGAHPCELRRHWTAYYEYIYMHHHLHSHDKHETVPPHSPQSTEQ